MATKAKTCGQCKCDKMTVGECEAAGYECPGSSSAKMSACQNFVAIRRGK